MAKLDPIVSEFESDEAAEAYDVWFRAQVEAALAETGPGAPHEQVMAEARAIIAKNWNTPLVDGSNIYTSP
jgi:Xaa-Pro aminopeptidase